MIMSIPKNLNEFVQFLKLSQDIMEGNDHELKIEVNHILDKLYTDSVYGNSTGYYLIDPSNWVPCNDVGIIIDMFGNEATYHDILSEISQLLISLES